MNELSRSLMPLIDKYVEEHTTPISKENAAQIAHPEIDRLAAENGIDPVDLLVDYLDHVAIISKKLNKGGEEKLFTEEEIESEGFKLY